MKTITPEHLKKVRATKQFGVIKAGIIAGEYQAVLLGKNHYNPLAGASSFARSAEPFDQDPHAVIVALHAIALDGLIPPDFLSRELPNVTKNKTTIPLLLAYINEYLSYEQGNRLLSLAVSDFLESIKSDIDFVPESSRMTQTIVKNIEAALATRVSPFTKAKYPTTGLAKYLVLKFEQILRKLQYLAIRLKQDFLGRSASTETQPPLQQEALPKPAIPPESESTTEQNLPVSKKKITDKSAAIPVLILYLISISKPFQADYALTRFLEYSLGLFVSPSKIVSKLIAQGYVENSNPEKTYIYTITTAGIALLSGIDVGSIFELLKEDVTNPELFLKYCPKS